VDTVTDPSRRGIRLARLRRVTRHGIAAVIAMDLLAVVLLGGLPSLDAAEREGALSRSDLVAATTSGPSAAVPAPTARPVTVRVDTIDVDAPVVPLGLEDDGTLEVPEGRLDAGWWSGGSVPGEPGPAVIVGHVNLRSGPAVFLRLHELAPGDTITVERDDGTAVDYIVTEVEQVAKEAFPTERVYGATDDATLRVITCGGSFRPADRSYVDNVIVYGELARSGAVSGSTQTPF